MTKVLVIDDNKEFLSLVEMILRRKGFEVYTYASGLNVYNVVSACLPDIVLLDVNLPGKSGIDVCNEIKQKLAVPVVLCSADADKEKSLEDCDADDFVEKPVEISKIIKVIDLHINQQVPVKSDSYLQYSNT